MTLEYESGYIMNYYDDLQNVKSYIDMAKDCYAIELVSKLNCYLENGSTILELGMGPGNDFELLNKSYHVTGSDKYVHFIDLYKAKNPKADVLAMDAVTLDINRTFDCIYSNKVLPHLTKEELKKSIEKQWSLLNENGILFHTFWKGDKAEDYGGMLNQYYLESELRDKFSEGFELLLIEGYKEFEEDDSILVVVKKIGKN